MYTTMAVNIFKLFAFNKILLNILFTEFCNKRVPELRHSYIFNILRSQSNNVTPQIYTTERYV
jgi:hypothetical protein